MTPLEQRQFTQIVNVALAEMAKAELKVKEAVDYAYDVLGLSKPQREFFRNSVEQTVRTQRIKQKHRPKKVRSRAKRKPFRRVTVGFI
jgi:hypothetical protein